jgi:hypothetical protein
MVNGSLSLRKDYWETFEITEKDIEFLNNHLFELETPMTSRELSRALITERIRIEKQTLQNQQHELGKIYFPKDHYQVGETLLFPAFDWIKGKVVGIREGKNPEVDSFEVIDVAMERGNHREFAAGLQKHELNRPLDVKIDDVLLDIDAVMKNYGDRIEKKVDDVLKTEPDLVSIAWHWFPRALLVDVNIGHLNLAEAVLDMSNGGPLPTKSLLEQIDMPTDVNPKLREFSLNLAIQEDPRFDEVGPAGEVVWYLRRLEPEPVQHTPLYLRYQPINYDRTALTPPMLALERLLDDELDGIAEETSTINEAVITLTYPHWRAGTLPLTQRVKQLFPTAYESPRIQFTLVDGDTGARSPGWVVRPEHYIFGLQEWYEAQGLIPGSLVHIKTGKKPGEVHISTQKRRSGREWIRTILVGADGGIVFAILKQMVSAAFDERMAIAIPDVEALDAVWEQGQLLKLPMDQVIIKIMRELAKLNPQGHVHAQELYAAVNAVRRCPPGLILSILSTHPIFSHVGDLHFRIETESNQGEVEHGS